MSNFISLKLLQTKGIYFVTKSNMKLLKLIVQCLAKLCVDSIDTLVRYLRENIKFSIKSLYFKNDYR